MFTGHRSKYIRERAHAASVSVTYAHTRTKPTVSIDMCSKGSIHAAGVVYMQYIQTSETIVMQDSAKVTS